MDKCLSVICKLIALVNSQEFCWLMWVAWLRVMQQQQSLNTNRKKKVNIIYFILILPSKRDNKEHCFCKVMLT